MATTRASQFLRLAAGATLCIATAAAQPASGGLVSLSNTAQAALERVRAPRRIVVSIADRKLALFEGNQLRRTWEIAVGKPSTPTPVGVFQVASQVKNPTWYGPQGPVAPGPKNPVGTRWIGLSIPGYGIHGTNAPKSIGSAASKGCIRMHADDVEELFAFVAKGDTVELVAEPSGMLARAFRPAPPQAKAVPASSPAASPDPGLRLTAQRMPAPGVLNAPPTANP
jgi:hypothetical protein